MQNEGLAKAVGRDCPSLEDGHALVTILVSLAVCIGLGRDEATPRRPATAAYAFSPKMAIAPRRRNANASLGVVVSPAPTEIAADGRAPTLDVVAAIKSDRRCPEV